jgi:ribosomal protein S18 acetylase RimI-like enzyme
MTSSHVRAADLADAPEIVRLGELMYAAVDIPADDAWRRNALRQLESRWGHGDLWAWVIDADVDDGGTGAGGRLAASALVNRAPRLAPPGQLADWRAYVQWVSTDPSYRRRGYARSLMLRVLEFARVEGLDIVELHSSPFGRELYGALGFRESPAVDYPADVRGVPMQFRVHGAARPAQH